MGLVSRVAGVFSRDRNLGCTFDCEPLVSIHFSSAAALIDLSDVPGGPGIPGSQISEYDVGWEVFSEPWPRDHSCEDVGSSDVLEEGRKSPVTI